MSLLELAVVAPIVAVAVTASFSLCVLGVTRSADARREGTSGAPWMLLAVVALLAVAAEIAFGLAIIIA